MSESSDSSDEYSSSYYESSDSEDPVVVHEMERKVKESMDKLAGIVEMQNRMVAMMCQRKFPGRLPLQPRSPLHPRLHISGLTADL